MNSEGRESRQPAAHSHTDATGAAPARALSLDAVFDAVSHPRRRYVVYALQHDDAWQLDDLAASLVKWETGRDGTVPEDDSYSAYVSLYHSHVPKLANLGVAEFDPECEVVTDGPNADRVRAALAAVDDVLDVPGIRDASGPRDGEGDERRTETE